MSKKVTKKKAGGSKKIRRKKVNVRKGGKKPFKTHGSRGIATSSALARKAKRERKAKNGKASGKALGAASAAAKKKEFLERMAKARAAKKAAAGSSTPAVAAAAPAAAAPKKKRRKKAAAAPAAAKKRATKKKAGKKRRKVGSVHRSRTASTPKFKLMHKWGFPSRRPLTSVKRAALRKAAGGVDQKGKRHNITAKQILDTIQAEKLKSWVCVGPRRTGCGGGAKNLRGGHQIGIFAAPR